MSVYHGEVKGRTKTGKKFIRHRKTKKKALIGSYPTQTKIGERKLKKAKGKRGQMKFKLLRDEVVNVYDPKTKKTQKTKIQDLIENPANKIYTRRKVITKGAILSTPLGVVRVTSRPGQNGVINAVKVEEE